MERVEEGKRELHGHVACGMVSMSLITRYSVALKGILFLLSGTCMLKVMGVSVGIFFRLRA